MKVVDKRLHYLRCLFGGSVLLYVFNNSQQTFLKKEPNKYDARRISACHTPLQKSSLDAVQ